MPSSKQKLIVYTKPGCTDSEALIKQLTDSTEQGYFEEQVVNPSNPPLELAILGHKGHYPFVVYVTEEPGTAEVEELKTISLRNFQK